MRSWHRFVGACAVLLLVNAPDRALAQELPVVRRIAVVVGTNAAPPGRRRLRFAEADAQATASVLRTVGGFASNDVDVLLDPTPERVLEAIDRRTRELASVAGESILLFHYAGHADAQSLYPGGRALSYDALRRRLGAPGPTVRIGIVDACRGGGWTGTRSLSETAPFDVDVPLDLASEGTVLIASSSGVEDARESEEIGAGFFTHHWNAALRGAADRNGDGIVGLGEAFDYAKRLTIRDSAATGNDPQHPSFQMNVRGRTDIPLARIAASESIVELHQRTGPTQVVRLDSGLLVLEVPSGERFARIALPPGHYLFRVRNASTTRAIDVTLRPRATVAVDETSMTPRRDSQTLARTAELMPIDAAATPSGMWDLRLALGVTYRVPVGFGMPSPADSRIVERSISGLGGVSRGFGRRAYWSFPLLFGGSFATARGGAIVPWGGVAGAGGGTLGSGGHFLLVSGMGVRTETPFARDGTFVLDATVVYDLYRSWGGQQIHRNAFTLQLETGLRASIEQRVDVGLGVFVYESLVESTFGTFLRNRPTLGIGSLPRGNRGLPLMRLHVSRVFSFDLFAMITYSFETERWGQTFLVGANAVWPGHAARRARRASESR